MSHSLATLSSVPHDLVASAATPAQLKDQIQKIQRAMAEVMIEGVHYGKIPGTPKPTLLKPGAEVLCAMFHIAPHYRIEDLSHGETLRYRVTCLGKSQISGLELGEGVGECSSDEAKYKWRAPVCDEEFGEFDDSRKRVKWAKGQGNAYQQKQVRTDSADQANTVLKMAAKRAQIAMVLNVLAASDIFAQDLDELTPEQIAAGAEQASARRPQATKAKQASKQATSAPQSTGGNGKITDGQKRLIFARLNDAGMSAEQLCQRFGVESVVDLPFTKVNEALAYIADPERDAIQGEPAGDE